MPQQLVNEIGHRPRVVYLGHVARLSGGEIALLRLLSVVRDYVEPLVILAEDGPLVDRLRELGVPVEVLPMADEARELRREAVRPSRADPRPLLETGRYIGRLTRRLRELRPELVHTNTLKAALYGGVAARAAGVPVVWHVRDRIADDYLPGAAVRMVRLASRTLPAAVIANSQSTLSTLPPRTASAVVSSPVIPDSVDAAAAHPPKVDDQLTIGVVGRLAEWKGQHVFLDAFAQAFPEGGACGRVIGSAMFGEEAYEQRLVEQAARLGLSERVEFRGFRDNVWAELAELDVLVHCSVTPEPFGQVVVEGMAAGVPVIAAAAGGPAEIVTDGVDGLLTPPGDVAALAQALRSLSADADERRRLAAAGQETASRYTPEQTARRVLQVYRDVLVTRRR